MKKNEVTKTTKTGFEWNGKACVVWASAIFVVLALGTELFGPLGEASRRVFAGLLGDGAWSLVFVLGFAGLRLARREGLSAPRILVNLGLAGLSSVAVQLALGEDGGVVGSIFGEGARSLLSTPGALLVCAVLAGAALAIRVDFRGLYDRLNKFADEAVTVKSGVRIDASTTAFAPPVNGAHVAVARSEQVRRARSEILAPQYDAYVIDTAVEGVDDGDRVAGQHRTVVREFKLPPSSLLSSCETLPIVDGASEEEATLLIATLDAYDVSAKVEGVSEGPTVTTFEVSVAPGTKLSKVIGLADDLSLAFGRKVRVVPSRPGRVGFEVGNVRRAPVGLRELVEDPGFVAAGTLPLALGLGVRGDAVYADLAEMPHVIVAGATGAGKSVCLNTMLASLLFARSPEELRLLMIDPKVVELQAYSAIPHMLAPVVTDMSLAVRALHWAISEMERRYQVLAAASAKNLASYNARVRASERLPHIVIVVDEFADLIASQGKAAEAALSRLAQKARAAGMHVILATQRPSVDVITGTIKANFPSRIAFRVAQKVDSRVILDDQGAEALLGKGDMLVKLGGSDAIVRVQGPMISEREIEVVTGHLSSNGVRRYDEGLLSELRGIDAAVKTNRAKNVSSRQWS